MIVSQIPRNSQEKESGNILDEQPPPARSERPRTSHGRRRPAPSTGSHVPETVTSGERPTTSRGRRAHTGRQSAERSQPDPYLSHTHHRHAKDDALAISGREVEITATRGHPGSNRVHRRQEEDLQRVEDENADFYIPFEGMARPVTSHGNRTSHGRQSQDLSGDPWSERPMTSKGRRSSHKQESVDTSSAADGPHRPVTSRGRTSHARDSVDLSVSPPPSQRQVPGQVDILTLDQDTGETAYTPTTKAHHRTSSQKARQMYKPTSSQLVEKYSRKKSAHDSGRRGSSGVPETEPLPVAPASQTTAVVSRHSPGRPMVNEPEVSPRPAGTERPITLRRGSASTTGSSPRSGGPASRPTSSSSISQYPLLPDIGVVPSPPVEAKPDSARRVLRSPQSDLTPPRRSVTPQMPPEADLIAKVDESLSLNKPDEQDPPPDKPDEKEKSNLSSDQVQQVAADTVPKDTTSDNPATPAANSELIQDFQPLMREVTLPPEPEPNQTGLLLAVKLPNGHRIQRNFSLTDTLKSVIEYAETEAKLDFSACELVCATPKRLFNDLAVTLQNSGLQNRTVLHIQTPDQ